MQREWLTPVLIAAAVVVLAQSPGDYHILQLTKQTIIHGPRPYARVRNNKYCLPCNSQPSLGSDG